MYSVSSSGVGLLCVSHLLLLHPLGTESVLFLSLVCACSLFLQCTQLPTFAALVIHCTSVTAEPSTHAHKRAVSSACCGKEKSDTSPSPLRCACLVYFVLRSQGHGSALQRTCRTARDECASSFCLVHSQTCLKDVYRRRNRSEDVVAAALLHPPLVLRPPCC